MIFIKDPAAVLDYGFDWSEWLDENETIEQSTWSVPEGLTLDDSNHTGTLAVAWLSDGTAGSVHRVTNRITTSAGRTEERSLTIRVEER